MLDGDLRLAIRAQPPQLAALADIGEPRFSTCVRCSKGLLRGLDLETEILILDELFAEIGSTTVAPLTIYV